MKGKAFGFIFSSSEVSNCRDYFLQLTHILKLKGYSVINMRLPGGDPVSDRIRNVILQEGELHEEALRILVNGAVVQAKNAAVLPAMEKGMIVLCKCEAGSHVHADFLSHTFFIDYGKEFDDDFPMDGFRVHPSAFMRIEAEPGCIFNDTRILEKIEQEMS